MDEQKTPATPVTKPEAPPAQRIDWSAVRDSAYAAVAARVRDLQNLEKVSKGKGVPSLHETADFARAVATVLACLPRESQKMGETLTTLWVQLSLRVDAVISLLDEKGLLEKSAIQAKMTTIIDEQKALLQKRQEEALAKSVEQVKKAE